MTASVVPQHNEPVPSGTASDQSSGTQEAVSQALASYRVVLYPDEDGRIVAKCTDLVGATSDGADVKEAVCNVIDAMELYLESFGRPKVFNLTVEHR